MASDDTAKFRINNKDSLLPLCVPLRPLRWKAFLEEITAKIAKGREGPHQSGRPFATLRTFAPFAVEGFS
ncbi:MAG TPA: hypothetical protein ENJ01_06210 [Gammaproteobacteria bacterium]|nr:hypothetical protein [Gammaproteobacteria bacterium]